MIRQLVAAQIAESYKELIFEKKEIDICLTELADEICQEGIVVSNITASAKNAFEKISKYGLARFKFAFLERDSTRWVLIIGPNGVFEGHKYENRKSVENRKFHNYQEIASFRKELKQEGFSTIKRKPKILKFFKDVYVSVIETVASNGWLLLGIVALLVLILLMVKNLIIALIPIALIAIVYNYFSPLIDFYIDSEEWIVPVQEMYAEIKKSKENDRAVIKAS